MQATLWSTAAEDGQLTLITGAPATLRLAESLSLPAELRTVTRMVFAPAELKLVEYDELLPEPPSLSLQA